MSRTRIDFLGLEVKLAQVVSDHINGTFPELPPLQWTYSPYVRLNGKVDEIEHADPESVAQAWREALRLSDGVDDPAGWRTFSGLVDGATALEVWYVTDRDRFEQK